MIFSICHMNMTSSLLAGRIWLAKSLWILRHWCFNPIQDWGAKRPPTSFFPLTYTNVGISPQNFLTCSFNSFATLV